MITASQVRACRALLRWSAQELAECCLVTRDTIVQIENKVGHKTSKSVTERITEVFDLAGLELIPGGVRFKGGIDPYLLSPQTNEVEGEAPPQVSRGGGREN